MTNATSLIIKNITNKKIASSGLLVSALVFSNAVLASTPISPNGINQESQSEVVQFSQAQLEQLLAPIALYPDTLLTHILIAATYPIEVIDADRFIKQYANKSEQDLLEKIADKDWDPSVKALVPFPRIVENLSNDLAWMRKLGDAFLQDESQVLASIQTLRQKADESGNLSQMDNVDIVREKQTIIIEPAEPEVIYVPYYDTRVVYGNWRWSHYPPVYWHRPAHYAYYHGPFYWQSSVHIGFDFFFSAFHWSNHHVVRHHHKKRYHRSNRRIATSHHAKRWNHNPQHRRGVAYRSKNIKHRYSSNRPSIEHNRVTRKHHNKVVMNTTHKAVGKERIHRSKAILPKQVTQKHRQVTKRLQVNQAVKIKDKKHRKIVQRNKGEKQYFSNKKVRANDHNVTKSQRAINTQSKAVNRVARNQSLNKAQKKAHTNVWKKPSQVKHVEKNARKIAPQKQYKASQPNYSKQTNSKQKNYKAKGGHSSKTHTRVAKNSSSRTKSHSSRNRQKH
jgi:hypothetical protein